MDQRVKAYLRPLRRRFGLTQRELAFLIGAKAGAVISRIERLKLAPNLARTRAFALVFGTRAPELFPELFEDVREAVRSRARELYDELQGNQSKTTRAKLDFLEEVLERLDREGDDTDV
jgi:transcriptional regulator with XRE-family HTH domain